MFGCRLLSVIAERGSETRQGLLRRHGIRIVDTTFSMHISQMTRPASPVSLATLLPLLRAVLARYDVTEPRLIGSIARGNATPTSDVDVLVRPGRAFSLIALQRLQDELAAVVGRRVDIVAEDSVPRDALVRMRKDAIVL